MKKQAKLETLPPEDQQRIFELCRDHTYAQVVAKVAEPRESGGLEIHTNRSSLCRFVQKHDTEPVEQRVEKELKRLREMDHADSLDYSNAIVRLVQERIFSRLLRQGQSIRFAQGIFRTILLWAWKERVRVSTVLRKRVERGSR